jgi:amino acid transporter
VAVPKAASLLSGSRGNDLPEGVGYSLKRKLLGPPLVNEQLSEERLSKPLALGVLSPDGISSSAYGSEEILVELLKGGLGIAAFTLLLPITGVVLFVLALVVLSYREVVMVYTKTGGSYVVARENFGPKVAQIAAVALMIDYTVTVAVQTAAGAAAIVSAFPSLTTTPVIGSHILLLISVVAILIMAYGNLRGIREAGRFFALPTYLFSVSVIIMIITGLAREAFGHLHQVDPAKLTGTYYSHQHLSVFVSLVLVFVLLKAFANGGSSLTGIEAVSNAVSAFRPPEGRNARQVLVTQGLILAFLVAGISWLAHVTHATPYSTGTPTVISQEASIAFGGGFGRVLFYFVQAATALILFTGGNTSFNGFPFLASFVAEDAFLPRWLTKRGHRLVYSNGIIVLTVLALALILAVGANVTNLVPFYAIGVFTGFSMAGFGMARYHTRHKEPGWRRRRVINFSAGVLSTLVVLIFAVTKFTEGAWLVVIIGPIGVFALIRLNREYRLETGVLETISGRQPPPLPRYARRTVLVFVDSFDLATLAALRYARSQRPTTLRAVHFVIDSARAEKLRQEWTRADRGIVLDFVDCPDRRLAKAAADLVCRETADPSTHVTAVLPRRSYSPLLGRLLHDRTADKMARVISRIPRSAATIIPYDVRSRLEVIEEREAARAKQRTDPSLPAVTGEAGSGQSAADAVTTNGAASPNEAGTKPGITGAGSGGLVEDRPASGWDAAHGPAAAVGLPPGGTAPGGTAPGGTAPGGAEPGGTAPGGTAPAGAAPGGDSADGKTHGTTTPGSTPDGGKAAGEVQRSLRHPRGRPAGGPDKGRRDARDAEETYARPVPTGGCTPIGNLSKPGRVTVEGRVRTVEIRPVERNSVLAVEITDSTGELTALFYGRQHIAGVEPGVKIRMTGAFGIRGSRPFMINPTYELLSPPSS